MIGLKRGTVKLVRHNPKWQQSFEREEKKIRKIFGRDILEIQHVGSTAIPGILAKPIIDIALIVPSLQKVKRYKRKLKKIGYEIKKNDTRKERLFFTKGPEKKRTHYLHIGEIGSGYTEDMILFRDYLRKHKDLAKDYSELKENLAKRYQDRREIYTAKKTELIKRIVKKAMIKDITIRRANIKDLNDILKLNFDLFKKEHKEYDKSLNLRWTHTEGMKYFKDRINKGGFVEVAEVKGKIIGYLCGGISKRKYYRKKAKGAELENMFIVDKFRNKGIGRKLIKNFVNWCKKNKVEYIKVTAFAKNKQAIDFYRKLGFRDYELDLKMKIKKL